MKPKLFVIRKYVFAKDVKDAIRKEKNAPVDDVWWDEDHKKGYGEETNLIGFKTNAEKN